MAARHPDIDFTGLALCTNSLHRTGLWLFAVYFYSVWSWLEMAGVPSPSAPRALPGTPSRRAPLLQRVATCHAEHHSCHSTTALSTSEPGRSAEKTKVARARLARPSREALHMHSEAPLALLWIDYKRWTFFMGFNGFHDVSPQVSVAFGCFGWSFDRPHVWSWCSDHLPTGELQASMGRSALHHLTGWCGRCWDCTVSIVPRRNQCEQLPKHHGLA